MCVYYVHKMQKKKKIKRENLLTLKKTVRCPRDLSKFDKNYKGSSHSPHTTVHGAGWTFLFCCCNAFKPEDKLINYFG